MNLQLSSPQRHIEREGKTRRRKLFVCIVAILHWEYKIRLVFFSCFVNVWDREGVPFVIERVNRDTSA